MGQKVLFSERINASEAVTQLKDQLGNFNASFIVFFASSSYDPQELIRAMNVSFKNAQVVGCTTSGELVSGRMLTNSIVAMAYDISIFPDLKIEVLKNVSIHSDGVATAFEKFERHFGTPMHALNPSKFVGITLIDGLSGAEERINESIVSLTNVSFIGGSVADDLKFSKTYIFAKGEVHTDAAVLMLMKPAPQFSILKTQSVKPTEKVLRVTHTVEASRKVLEFDHAPAAAAYAGAIGVDEDDLPLYFSRHPLGAVTEDKIAVRSPKTVENEGVLFYHTVEEGDELTLLESTDIVSDTAMALDLRETQMGGISSIISFNCVLRTLDLQRLNKLESYGELFSKIPTIGFNTYGESHRGHHNHTATMLLLGARETVEKL